MKHRLIIFGLTFCMLVALVPAAKAEVQRREVGSLVLENIPDIPDRIVERMRQYQNVRSANLEGWLPDGSGILITTRFGETSQLHKVAMPGGARQQWTFFEEPIREAKLRPGGSGELLFMKDVGGSESYQIFHFDPATGLSRLLTDGTSRFGAIRWSHDGTRFAFTSTQRNGRDWDIYVASIDSPTETTMVHESTGYFEPLDWSPDDSRLLLEQYVSINESYYHILDLATGKIVPVNPSDAKIAYSGGKWSADGKGLYFASDEGTEFRHLRYYDLASGKITTLTADIPWDVQSTELSPDGSLLAFIVNNNGSGDVYIMSTADRSYRMLEGLPLGRFGSLHFAPDGKTLGLVVNTPRTPGDVYAVDVNNHTVARWTFSEVGGLNTDALALPRLVAYPTFDSVDGKPRMIPAYLYRPATEGPYPVLVAIHGGPESQYRPNFSSRIQYVVNELGMAVVAPNVRGSAGYGKSYLLMDNGFNREKSVQDIGSLLDWIAEQPELDASRVVVYGGSYGGYMVLASMTHFNDRLKAAIDVVGISNFVTFLENTNPYRQDMRRAEYGDERDPEMRVFLEKISPTTSAHLITRPMFIAQGANDPRVPATESDQMVKEIRENGGAVWYMLARDEGHGFRKKVNRDYFNHAMMLFLEEQVLE